MAFAALVSFTAAGAITIDGAFEDWSPAEHANWYPAEGNIRRMWITSDDKNIYCRMDCERAPSSNTEFSVYIDLDANRTTGCKAPPIMGADTLLHFKASWSGCEVSEWSDELKAFHVFWPPWRGTNKVATSGCSVELNLNMLDCSYFDPGMIKSGQTIHVLTGVEDTFSPRYPYTLVPETFAIATDRWRWNVFYPEEPLVFTVNVNEVLLRRGKALRLDYAISDFHDQRVQTGSKRVTSRKGKLAFGPTGKGIFYVRMKLKAGEQMLAEKHDSFAVIARAKVSADSPFGVEWFSLNSRLARASGIRWSRETFYWPAMERSKGEFFWGGQDESVQSIDRMIQNGLRPLVCFLHTAPWAVSAKYGKGRHDSILLPPERRHWEEFIAAAVRRYKGRVRYWQINNEIQPGAGFWAGTEDEYLEYLKAAYTTAKTIDPECKIVMGSIADFSGHDNPAFLDRLCQKGAWQYCDILSVHCYQSSYRDTLHLLKGHQKVARRYAPAKPLWVTETGWGSRGRKTEMRVAGRIVTHFTAVRELGIERVFYFSTRDFSDDPGNYSATYGLFNWDLSPKAGFVAYQVLISKLWNAAFLKKVSKGDIVATVFHAKNKPPVIVMWSNGVDSIARLPAKFEKTIGVTGIVGQRVEPGRAEGDLTIPLSADLPVYLEGEGAERLSQSLETALNAQTLGKGPTTTARKVELRGAARTIRIDGELSDWTEDLAYADDARGDVENPCRDLTRVWVTNDDRNLYFRVDMVTLSSQAVDDLYVFLDTDDNLQTGSNGRTETLGVRGAEYQQVYAPQKGVFLLVKWNAEEGRFGPEAAAWSDSFSRLKNSQDRKSFEGVLPLDFIGARKGQTIGLLFCAIDHASVENTDWAPEEAGDSRFAYVVRGQKVREEEHGQRSL